MNARHRALAARIIDQANNRSKNEAIAEKRKIDSLPTGRVHDVDFDSWPNGVVSPRSTVETFTGEALEESWLGDGFTFSKRMR